MNSLLPDANVVIDVHRLGFWQQFIEKNRVYVASTVYKFEAVYYPDAEQRKISINLRDELDSGKLVEVSADIGEINSLKNKFDLALAPKLGLGELECLRILEKRKDLKFCTCDGAAIRALTLLGLEGKGMSLEKALRECGLQKNLPTKYSEQQFKWHVKQGQRMRTMGQGLR